MTPYEVVRQEYAFPFDFRKYQIDEFNYLAPFDRAGYYWDPGTGKTAGSTHHALYWKITAGVGQWVVVQPPILLPQWDAWLKSVRRIDDGEPPTVTVYTGTPGQRQKLSLDSEFILTSYGMFKNDFDRFMDHFEGKKVGTICDEATAIKNTKSDNHKAIKMFSEGRPVVPLTGTPLAKPGDAYAYIRLLTGNKIYRNQRHFEQLHVEEVDEYDRVTKWCNLELLAQNMRVQTSRIIRREVRDQLPPIVYQPIPYNLHPDHLKLYNRLAEEKLVEFADGQEINAMSAAKLRSAMQQIVCNWGHFEGNPSRRPAILDVIDNTFEEIGPDKKLVIVANFQMTNRSMLEALQPYGTVAVYGEVTPKAKQEALRRFMEDAACRCLQVQPQSAGMGLDGLQLVCSDMLVIEAPALAFHFHQTVARLDRDGQDNPVLCRIAVAQKTVQVKLFRDLLNNDAEVNSVQGGYRDLRDSIYGG
jgi:SNF2 family DNA or RNA helicase